MRLKINLKLYVIIFLFYHFFSGYVYCFSLNDLLLENIFNVEITDFRYIIADTNLAVTKTVLPEPQKNKKFCFIDMKSKTKLFGEKKFSELEKYYSQCLETRLDYDSRHNMTSFIWLIYKDIKNAAELSADWQKEFPKSHLPHLLNACLSIDKAWEARGTGWASSVTEEGWKEMNRYLIVGLDELKTAYELNPADPNIGAVGVIVTMGMDCNLASAKAWFNRAMNADPYHVSAYMQMMNILWPKWGGSYELAKSVVDDALTKTDFNPQLFAALPLYYEEYCERLSDSDENPKWKRKTEYKKIYDSILKKKYEKAAKKYPDEYQIRARYGMDALEQKDRELGLKQLELAIELIESGKSVDFPYFSSYNCSIYSIFNKYAWILSTSKNEKHYNPERALIYAKKTVELAPEWVWGIDTLANAYAAIGDFKTAIETQTKAMQYGNETFQRTSRKKISNFEKGIAPRY